MSRRKKYDLLFASLSSNMQSRPKRNSSSTQEKYFDSTLTFCFYQTLVRLLSTLVKNSLTDSFMCLRIKWCDPGDNYAKSKLVFIGSLMTASDVRRDSWRSLSFVICQVKSNSFNPVTMFLSFKIGPLKIVGPLSIGETFFLFNLDIWLGWPMNTNAKPNIKEQIFHV